MKVNVLFSAVIFTVFCLPAIDSSNILAVCTSHSKSHLIVYMGVVDDLIQKGHNVTIITTLPIKQSSPRLRHIQLEEVDHRDMMKNLINSNSTWSHFQKFFGSLGMLIKAGDNALKDPKMKEFLEEKNNKFDLLLMGYFFNDYQIGLGAHFKVPIVLIWTAQAFGNINKFFGNPSEISHVPSVFVPQKNSNNMSFFERTLNLVFWIIEEITTPLLEYQMRWYYDDNFPSSKYPAMEEVKKNISLLLCNHHFSEGPIRANVPGIIEIGGIQIKPKPDPLPKDIKEFLEKSSKDGAIFFSLGSNAQSSDLQPETITIIYKVLSSLKQNVLWKWEDDIKPGNSPNILFSKWLPQDDILAHPNIRLFVTHGGKGSVVEAKYHGVPMVGIPIFADQPMNVRTLESDGYGKGLDLKTLTVNSMKETILEVVENPKYRENVRKFSKLYRDRPMTARDTATYWIEYIIRNNGAYHIQSSAIYLSRYEYLGLDVAAFLIVMIYVIWKLLCFIGKFVWRKITCQGKVQHNLENEKKEKQKKM